MIPKKTFLLTNFLAIIFTASTVAQNDYSQTGDASVYSDKFEGRYTASGEKYSPNEYTAAHLTLPFDTHVKVTNLTNNKTVVVRINDRGPFIRGRIIDLSSVAAKQLGITDVAKVKIETTTAKAPGASAPPAQNPQPAKEEKPAVTINNIPENTPTDDKDVVVDDDPILYQVDAKVVKPTGFTVQVGSFKESANMLKLVEETKVRINEPIYIQVARVNGSRIYRVMLGNFSSKQLAERFQESIKPYFNNTFIVAMQ